MKNIFKNKYFILLITVTVVLLISMGIYSTGREKVSPVESGVSVIVKPFQTAFGWISDSVVNFFKHFGDVSELKTENELLKNDVSSLENTVREYEKYKIENERLKAMLEFKNEHKEYNLVSAKVSARDSLNWFDSFTIDKGTDDGLKVNQTVITTAGLVGHICDIGNTWARVLVIIDSSCSAGAYVSRTGDIAVAEGDVELQQKGLCKITYIANSASIITGDLIETSGLGGKYPSGILIGKVREIFPETESMSQYAVVEPAVDFEHIKEVFVITNMGE